MSSDILQHHWQRFLQTDDEKAFEHIYSQCVSQLYAYGMGLGFVSDTCKDAMQDVFFKLYTSKQQLTHIENLQFYLFRSMRNRLLDIKKKHDSFHSLDYREIVFATEITVLDHLVNEEERNFIKQRVEALLSTLTARQREVIYLRYMQNMEYNDIANLLNMAPQSVRQLVHRGLTSIREATSSANISTYSVILSLFSVLG